MRGRGGYMTLKGRQYQISLYLPPEQYWLLRATSRRTGFSMQYLLRQALEAVLREARRFPFTDGGRKQRTE
ncbi:MAG: ribbon-helix-helix domain-containing protein [Gammaproteobacteria bacterium]|nr:ribbon-helix-helix domain-containing protein [Gammaproteobacteria bacterium]MBV8306848.1 ribbon-helix-helix domain-containing protein [Gammaproteobacteria bacterium]